MFFTFVAVLPAVGELAVRPRVVTVRETQFALNQVQPLSRSSTSDLWWVQSLFRPMDDTK